jgi:hypothetical protein
MGLYNFQTGNNAILSYQTKLLSTSTSSTIVNLNLVGANSSMVFLAFSVLVIT